MAENNFFDALGEKLSKATHTAVDKTGVFLSSTRISAQIAGEQREMEKLYQKLGETVYRMAEEGQFTPDGEVARLVLKIRNRLQVVQNYRKDLAGVKNQNICPHCGNFIDQQAVYCPKCGAEIPVAAPAKPKPGEKKAPVDAEIEIEEAVSLDDFADEQGDLT